MARSIEVEAQLRAARRALQVPPVTDPTCRKSPLAPRPLSARRAGAMLPA
jgi:hypothetical protein